MSALSETARLIYGNIDSIYIKDKHHMDSNKQHGNYYIGYCDYNSNFPHITFASSISSSSLFKFKMIDVYRYLFYFSLIKLETPQLQIMKLHILEDGLYTVSIKTNWIRLIQRHWKQIYKKRLEILNVRLTLQNIRVNEITGKYPIGYNNLPSIHGMLSMYSKTNEKSLNIRID
jgi:hypothetical protein